MVVLTDRLSKGVVTDGLPEITAEAVVDWFLQYYYLHHFLPRAIVSDRGTQFMSAFWKRICDTLGIQHRLSTSFSPETDGSTERANKVVQIVLRKLVNWSQKDWVKWLQVGVSAICGWNAASTGIAPFFMTHGWNQEVFQSDIPPDDNRESLVSRAD
jgi:transposase InsO family protein